MDSPALQTASRSIREQVSAEEWDLRVTLAACYRAMARYGMTDMIYNHITARVPNSDHHVLINPYGMLYEEVTASSLYKIDLDGNVILQPDTPYGLNYAGFVIHSAVHAAREDAICVIHTHTRAGVAVSAMQCGLLPISQHALRFFERIGYHDYEGPALRLDERERLVANLGDFDVMLLRNHGTLALGRSVPEAFNIAYFLECACRIQIDAMAGGTPLVMAGREAAEAVAQASLPGPENRHGVMDGMREWPAMLRLLDRSDPTYAD